MWEDAAPKPLPEHGAAEQLPAAAPAPVQTVRAGENCLLWVQILLCGLALAAVYAAKALDLPLYRDLRVACTAALEAPGPFLGEERQFVKFAQETWTALHAAAQEAWARLASPAAPAAGTKRPELVRTKPKKQTPSGCKEETYLPDFALSYPLPAATWATSGYGWRTDPVAGEGDEFHYGMDLHAAEGTPVLAAADGVVRRAGRGASYGNYLRILHANGDETLYAHMQYLFVRSGQQVHAGEVLGTVGHTGNVTGPHLHFELLHEGWRYDPAEALQNAAP